jgi:hypothetical protein
MLSFRFSFFICYFLPYSYLFGMQNYDIFLKKHTSNDIFLAKEG